MKKHMVLDTISIGNTANFTIGIYNPNNQNIVVRKIKPSCGCTIMDEKDSILEPNQVSVLHGKFKPEEKGRYVKSIIVETNADTPFVLLTIKGVVE